MHADFHKLDPMWRPDWRFQRALKLLDAGRHPGRWDDEKNCAFGTRQVDNESDTWESIWSWRGRWARNCMPGSKPFAAIESRSIARAAGRNSCAPPSGG